MLLFADRGSRCAILLQVRKRRSRNRNPHLMGIVGGQTVRTKSRQQADDSAGDTFGCDGKAVMFAGRCISECVDATCPAHEKSLSIEVKQGLTRDPARLDVSRTDQRLVRRQFENTLCAALGHVSLRW